MPETVSLNDELGIIEVRSFGDVTVEDIEDSFREIKRVREESGVGKVLVDASEQTSMPGTADSFKITSNMPHFVRIAVFISEGQSTEEDLLFVETLAISCGAIFRVYYSKEEAIDWLFNL